MGEVIAFPAIQQEHGIELSIAVGAECLYGFAVPDQEYLADVITLHRIDFDHERICVSADIIPGLQTVRQQARLEAGRILENNRLHLCEGRFNEVPLDVDALGTARKVAEIEKRYGKKSLEFAEAREGLELDCGRKWAEAFRKNSWEYFGITSQQYREETDELFAHNLSVDEFIVNGLSPVAEPEEADRRTNDFVRLHTNKKLLQRPDADDIAVVHIDPCPQWALESYKKNPKAAHGGYAPEIEKLMIEFDKFDTRTNEVHHEQIGVSGENITTDVINEAFRRMGLTDGSQELDKSDIHATTGIVPKTVITSAADVLRVLDEVASEMSGENIFLGEVVDETCVKNYNLIYEESEARRVQQQKLTIELADYVEELHRMQIEPALATVMVEQYVQKTMLEVASSDPEKAEIIFDKETAEGFREVQSLRMQGRHQEAVMLQERVEYAAPMSSSCGAGSCGLEGVSMSTDEGKKLFRELKAEQGDKIVKDKERACKCGAKEVVYAYNTKKVNKLCTACGAFESKKTA